MECGVLEGKSPPVVLVFAISISSIALGIATTSGAIAAHHRDLPNENMGFSFVNCVINVTGKIYLGRAWGKLFQDNICFTLTSTIS
ncbi:hypothetical protein Dsin_022153 [Dipteronia sinensis]|uniref:Uncharacterized protein n=1 Tax=Dipteronia sinensis TaxID=43782 RepID=A0AAE0A182_9ROSI|nr:hypothetical protein Dsin_022153 [Dipteronia sinensis]